MRRFGEQGSKFARQGGRGGSMKKEKRSDGVLAERKVDQSEEKELEEKENEEDSGRESDDLRETEPHSFEEEEEEEEDRREVKMKEQGEEGKQGQEEENPKTLCEKDPKEEMVKDVADWKGFELNSDAGQQKRGLDGVVVQFSYWTHGL